ncbi:2,3-bisphosphoglycerate-independent phosphoglycerate mutase [Candidatus Woesearchaeota archaeon]|nr:2,3-bisphosphoglycerate-independent phosphoglycerate mutase [Candidatus Woesearchaeota archaeon]
MKPKEKAMLIILDGWGVRKSRKDNAVKMAKTPNFDRLWQQNPHTTLYAAEQHVGLPRGFIGNSEVGHTHLGAGRLVPQELLKINRAIRDRSFFRNKVLLEAMQKAKQNHSALHVMGLLSDGGVHSHINHLFALLEMAKKNNVGHVYIHCFLDGRDKPPKSAQKYIRMLENRCKKLGIGRIATMMGRFYAMDRDNRWNREHKAYDAMVNHKGRIYSSAMEAIKDAYRRGETDEFVKPSIILSKHMKVKHYVQENDAIIFFNFREDRARELTRAFVQGKFRKFKRKKIINLHFVCLTQYDRGIRAPAAFPPHVPPDVLGEVMWNNKVRQLRIAETEKYAHVTYFFNGGRDGPFPLEDRVMIPSPHVVTYDKTPAMSAYKIADEAVKRIKSGRYPLIILNFANADMVGHTGILKAAVKAVEAADDCLGKVVSAARDAGYNVIVAADHGNAEEMSGRYQTSHTMNKVPFILLANKNYRIVERKQNSIANISPTILKLMGMKGQKVYFESLVR